MHRPRRSVIRPARRPPTRDVSFSRTQTARAISRWPTCLLGQPARCISSTATKTEPLDFANPVSLQNGDVNGITFVAYADHKVVCGARGRCLRIPRASLGFFLIVREGEHNPGLPVRFALGGTAQMPTITTASAQLVHDITYTTKLA